MNRFRRLICLSLCLTVIFLRQVEGESPLLALGRTLQPGDPPVLIFGETAYFQFRNLEYPETFVFQTMDASIIQQARAILAGQAPSRRIAGTVIKEPAAYNPPWSYHLDPVSISFFDFSIEVCDATILAVEQHLDEVCGSFLPGCHWCPWGSRLVAEIQVEYIPYVVR